jgi:hypothetical protein
MKRSTLQLAVLLLALSLLSCGGKETAASIAKKWCDLNGKVFKAAEGAEKDAAKAARGAFEKTMEEKYKSNETFFKEILAEVEKCEDASEGK